MKSKWGQIKKPDILLLTLAGQGFKIFPVYVRCGHFIHFTQSAKEQPSDPGEPASHRLCLHTAHKT